MATPQNLRLVERLIMYSFEDKDNLKSALIAAGAEEDNYDGNRQLANLGTAIIEFLAVFIGYTAGSSRENATNLKRCISNVPQRAKIAQKLGIDGCVKYGVRGGSRNQSVQGKAVNAIVGATFVDSDDLTTTMKVVLRLGLLDQESDTIDPQMLEVERLFGCPTLKSVANIFLKGVSNDISSFKLVERQQTQNGSTQVADFPADVRIQSTQAPSIVTNFDFIDQLFYTMNDTGDALSQSGNSLNEAGTFSDYISSEHTSSIRGAVQTLETAQITYIDDTIMAEPQTAVEILLSENLSENFVAETRNSPEVSRLVRNKRLMATDDSVDESRRSQTRRRQNDDTLARYLSNEKGRCIRAGHREPTETFYSTEVRQAIEGLKKSDAHLPETIVLGIASSGSIAALQIMLRNCRMNNSSGIVGESGSLTIAEHYKVIKGLDELAAHSSLLARYHILQLFKKSGGSNIASSTGTVQYMPKSSRQPNPLGNPRNLDEAGVAIKMMKEMFPDDEFRVGKENKHPKYKVVTKLRKLGRRIHIFVTKFGEGILGLFQPKSLTSPDDLGITDDMIMSLDDAAFNVVMGILEQSQGDMLRRFSQASRPVVDALVHGKVKESASFPIELVNTNEIIDSPKGSEALLHCLSRPSVRM